MTPGDIFLGQFPFGDVAGMKLRPVLLVSDVVGPASEVLVAYISSGQEKVPATKSGQPDRPADDDC